MYRDYASYIKEKIGMRVQKIALNPGFNCPNRDGKIVIKHKTDGFFMPSVVVFFKPSLLSVLQVFCFLLHLKL